MGKVRAVIFDLYETLITEYAGGMRKTDRSNRDYEAALGIPNELFKKEWGRRQKERMTGLFPNYDAVVRDILQSQERSAPDAVIQTLYEERIAEKAVPFEEASPELLQLLDGIKQKGIKLGLISNCTEEEVRFWRSCAFASYFDEVIFSYEVGLAKPDVRIYELAANRLGVKPEEAVFIGDGGSGELEGAAEAGMRAFHAVWFIPESISGKIIGYRKLEQPMALLEEIKFRDDMTVLAFRPKTTK